jgi:hypothetical protein
LALAASLVAATPAAAASPTACRVKNLDTGVTKYSLLKAHDAAKKGHRLTVRGVCAGPTTISKSLTITGIRTRSSGKPILDGKLSGSVVTVRGPSGSSPIKVTMKSLTVRNGATDWAGGGILNEGHLVLRDVVVRANTAANPGGGVASIIRGTLTLNGSSSIRGNHSGTSGGGVASTGTFILNGSSSIKDNTAAFGSGGVFNSEGTLTMNGSSTIEGNAALFSGGVSNQGTLVMKDSSSIRANTADNYAGGVGNEGLLKMRGSASITANVTTGPGGGVYNDGGTLDGVRCPMPGAKPNVRDNTPDNCYPDPLLQ